MPVPRPRRAALAAVCAALCAVLCAAPSLGGGAPNLLSVAFNHDRPRQADDPLSPVDADMGQVAAVRARLAAEPDALVWMEGHASLVGSASYNLALAERRARYLLNGLGVASRAARGEDYSAGCKKVGAGVVTCGELHATGNAASSRRVDVHFVPKPAEDKPKGGPQQEEQQDDEEPAEAKFACVDCNDMDPRMYELCREVVEEGQPCAAYRLVWRRLCRRTCLGVNRMRCADVERVCTEDPDCSFLCHKFMNHLCPDVEPAANLVRTPLMKQDPCPGTALH